ncbi:universal stress protein [Steroidobacter cummioxidans]|uniref:universal stress protein n=1 Tax=Steroidobacter cummioxidans TaxID=1803913 RepID=UPI00128FF11B|nr:universal stress protein [Steroidobacter cummioxidans]
MTRLLCATDLLPKSEMAVDRAGILAAELGADLSLLHVVSPTASERVLEQELQIAIARMRSRVRPPLWRHGAGPEVVVRPGNPVRLICDTIEREQSDLLIIGPHERRNVVDGVSGTIAEKVLSARKCPLLLVQQEADVSYRNVLFALDDSPESGLAVRAAESLVLRPQSQATVLHVYEPPLKGMVPSARQATTAYEARDRAATGIQQLLSRESADDSRYEVLLEEGHPIPAILRAVERHQPQLLVMGTRAVSRMRRALLGSVANQLLKVLGGCDVLIVPRDSIRSATSAGELRPTVSGA